jgi:hypothetical protein
VNWTYLVGSSLSLTQYLIEALLEQFLEAFSMLLGGIVQWAPAKGISGKVEGPLEVVV